MFSFEKFFFVFGTKKFIQRHFSFPLLWASIHISQKFTIHNLYIFKVHIYLYNRKFSFWSILFPVLYCWPEWFVKKQNKNQIKTIKENSWLLMLLYSHNTNTQVTPLFKYKPFINFWLWFFDTKRETIFKNLSYQTMLTTHPIFGTSRGPISISQLPGWTPTSQHHGRNSNFSTPWSELNFFTPWSEFNWRDF